MGKSLLGLFLVVLLCISGGRCLSLTLAHEALVPRPFLSLGHERIEASFSGPDGARLLGPALFGLINGFTLGYAGVLRDRIRAIGKDPVCSAELASTSRAASASTKAVIALLKGVMSASARGGQPLNTYVHRNLDHLLKYPLKDLVTSVYRFANACSAFRTLAGMLATMLLVGLATTLILWALPGLGWVAWLVGVAGTLIAGLPFLQRTLQKVLHANDAVTLVEGSMEAVGAVACLLFTTGATRLLSSEGRAQVAAKLSRTELASMFKGTFQPNPKLVETFERFSALMRQARRGEGDVAEITQLAK